MSRPNILTLGCSNSSTSWGLSWPDFVSENLNYNLLRASSNGAGNAFFIEKLHYVLRHSKVDLVIIQLTEPSRVVLGLTKKEKKSINEALIDSHSINDIGCYTWSVNDNEANLKRETGFDIKINNFWNDQVVTSKWIDYKVMQDVATMQYLCESFNVSCIFWSWFKNMEELFIEPYSWLKPKIKWIPGSAGQWLYKNNIMNKPELGGHYNTEDHKKLTNEWLQPEINKLLCR